MKNCSMISAVLVLATPLQIIARCILSFRLLFEWRLLCADVVAIAAGHSQAALPALQDGHQVAVLA